MVKNSAFWSLASLASANSLVGAFDFRSRFGYWPGWPSREGSPEPQSDTSSFDYVSGWKTTSGESLTTKWTSPPSSEQWTGSATSLWTTYTSEIQLSSTSISSIDTLSSSSTQCTTCQTATTLTSSAVSLPSFSLTSSTSVSSSSTARMMNSSTSTLELRTTDSFSPRVSAIGVISWNTSLSLTESSSYLTTATLSSAEITSDSILTSWPTSIAPTPTVWPSSISLSTSSSTSSSTPSSTLLPTSSLSLSSTSSLTPSLTSSPIVDTPHQNALTSFPTSLTSLSSARYSACTDTSTLTWRNTTLSSTYEVTRTTGSSWCESCSGTMSVTSSPLPSPATLHTPSAVPTTHPETPSDITTIYSVSILPTQPKGITSEHTTQTKHIIQTIQTKHTTENIQTNQITQTTGTTQITETEYTTQIVQTTQTTPKLSTTMESPSSECFPSLTETVYITVSAELPCSKCTSVCNIGTSSTLPASNTTWPSFNTSLATTTASHIPSVTYYPAKVSSRYPDTASSAAASAVPMPTACILTVFLAIAGLFLGLEG